MNGSHRFILFLYFGGFIMIKDAVRSKLTAMKTEREAMLNFVHAIRKDLTETENTLYCKIKSVAKLNGFRIVVSGDNHSGIEYITYKGKAIHRIKSPKEMSKVFYHFRKIERRLYNKIKENVQVTLP